MRASGKKSRKLYCTEEECAAAKDYIAKRRAGEVLGHTSNTDRNTQFESYVIEQFKDILVTLDEMYDMIKSISSRILD